MRLRCRLCPDILGRLLPLTLRPIRTVLDMPAFCDRAQHAALSAMWYGSARTSTQGMPRENLPGTISVSPRQLKSKARTLAAMRSTPRCRSLALPRPSTIAVTRPTIESRCQPASRSLRSRLKLSDLSRTASALSIPSSPGPGPGVRAIPLGPSWSPRGCWLKQTGKRYQRRHRDLLWFWLGSEGQLQIAAWFRGSERGSGRTHSRFICQAECHVLSDLPHPFYPYATVRW